MTMTSNVLEMNYSQLQSWWDDYRESMLGWAYLKEPAPKLMTTLYAQMVVEGSISASDENIKACQRHLNDLKRQGTEDFPWIFDEERAWRPIRFIEKKCRPSKGEMTRLVLQPWQHFVIGSLCGWVHKDTGVRRFREGLIFVGRKNGKTTLESGLANYMCGFDGENGANCYFLANSQKQSRILFDESKAMIEKSPYLSERFDPLQSEIRFPSTNSKMVAMSAEKTNKDGENLYFGVFDEIHEYEDYTLINVMKRSRGMRKQPLIIYITTAGYVLDGPLMDFIDDAHDCLDNYDDHIDERTFYYISKLNDVESIDDPETWIEANPNICLMDMVSMVTDFIKDRKNPQQLADWITKQFNIFSDTSELSFVDTETIDKNNRNIDLKTLEGRQCVGGYDLSETEDFTAACLEFPLDDGSVFILEKSWIPHSRYLIDKNPRRLDEWVKQGYLEIIPGDYVNYEYVYRWFVEQSKKYNIVQVNYDKAKALFLNGSLEEYGFNTQEVRQGFITLGGPMQNFKEMMLDAKVVFNNSKMFRWYLNNVHMKRDRNGNWLPTKQNQKRKIDGFAAALNAHVKVLEMLIKPNQTSRIHFVSFKDL